MSAGSLARDAPLAAWAVALVEVDEGGELGSATTASAPSSPKRSSGAAGNRSCSTGGMNAARAICQNGVAVKLSRHHRRQCSTARWLTPTGLVHPLHALGRSAVLHDRDEYDDRGEVDLGAEEAQRRRRRSRAESSTAQQKPNRRP
jgi:hypothetical protein